MRRTLPVLVVAALALAACGGSDAGGADPGSVAPDSSEIPLNVDYPPKPSVDVPDTAPSELVVTVLREGSGPAAASGDTVIVDYVGVRTVDGVEFDNSYDRLSPYPVTLGGGMVIAGWDEGLIGAQSGARIQLDIPSDMAYGETARDEIIRENEDLTFVIDVRAVIPAGDPADEPEEMGVEAVEDATELSFEDLVVGDGDTIELGQNAVLRYVLFRGDNGVKLESNWGDAVLTFTLDETGFPVLFEGLQGMRVGGRRAITIPPIFPEWGFGPDGNPTAGLPADTDSVLVVDLVAIYGEPS